MTQRKGFLIIDSNTVQVIWEDEPMIPQPFPLIFLRPTRSKKYGKIEYEIKQGQPVYTIRIPIQQNEVVWPGSGVLRIETQQNDQALASSKEPIAMFSKEASDTPMETAEIDAKSIEHPMDGAEHREPISDLRIRWDSNTSVFRNSDTGEIIGAPKWSLWKTLKQTSQEYRGNLKWNPFLRKYQVDTIKTL